MASKVRPFLWFVDNLRPAVARYREIFGDAFQTRGTDKVPEGSPSSGEVLLVTFTLFGAEYMAMQAGPYQRLSPAYSMYLSCDDQAEVDRYWAALLEGGGQEIQCGWLTDPFGVSWQVVPKRFEELMSDPDRGRAQRTMAAMLKMKKLDIAELERAANG